jgi:hypothetical protein
MSGRWINLVGLALSRGAVVVGMESGSGIWDGEEKVGMDGRRRDEGTAEK